MDNDAIAANIAKVLAQVRAAAEKYQRDPAGISLLAVSKTMPESAVRAAAAAGQRDFGENYLQDALEKIEACEDLPLRWHFIGPVQSNKTRSIAAHFDWVHSVDRDKILRRLNDQRPESLPPLNVCLQVNVSGETSKSGLSAAELPALAATADALPRLRLRGLMAIPAPSDSFDEQRAACEALAASFRSLRDTHPGMDTLSMGMSSDLEAAVAAGSTLLRIGTAIFGPRDR